MGNCNSVDPACATLEHPNGKIEKLDFSSSARQLMLQHPGHYVALLPPPPTPSADRSIVHLKQKLKLLPPDTMLNIGSSYRLVSFEDVLLELSDTGNMTHQTSRKTTQTNTSVSKYQHQPVQILKGHTLVSTAAAKRVNQLRAMLSKSIALHKEKVSENLPLPMAPAAKQILSIQSPLPSLYPMQRARSWRPNLQSISERGR
ncbi:hypothetical protein KC19_10G151900 [Ceratodon purpureus]|uniref:Uncharacterized protein n=1 Tax=Ceratodon purpureus TaxID=3225 RepID=A0A8T0GKI9_CERPU|nr:hypothetical protein KC19_10G151900 [Ceratodon purpureus]